MRVAPSIINSILAKRARANMNGQAWDGTTSIHLAAECGHADVVELLINEGANIHVRNQKLQTPLHRACIAGQPEIVDILLKYDNNNISLNMNNIFSLTPLFEAVQQNNLQIVKKLVYAHAIVNTFDETGLTPLDWAVMKDWLPMVRFLIPHSNFINPKFLLNTVIENNSNEAMEILCASGIKIDQPIDSQNNTPLHLAVNKFPNAAIVKTLLKYGANDNIPNIFGNSARCYDKNRFIWKAKQELGLIRISTTSFIASNPSRKRKPVNNDILPQPKRSRHT